MEEILAQGLINNKKGYFLIFFLSFYVKIFYYSVSVYPIQRQRENAVFSLEIFGWLIWTPNPTCQKTKKATSVSSAFIFESENRTGLSLKF